MEQQQYPLGSQDPLGNLYPQEDDITYLLKAGGGMAEDTKYQSNLIFALDPHIGKYHITKGSPLEPLAPFFVSSESIMNMSERLVLGSEITHTKQHIETVGSDSNAFRVMYRNGTGLLIDWAESPAPTTNTPSSDKLPAGPLMAAGSAGVFGIFGAYDLLTGPNDVKYLPIGAAVIVGNALFAYIRRKKAKSIEQPKPFIQSSEEFRESSLRSRQELEHENSRFIQALRRDSEFNQAIHINSTPVRLSLSDANTPESFGREYPISIKEFLSSLWNGGLSGFGNYDNQDGPNGIYTIHLPGIEKEEHSKLPASNKSKGEHFIVIDDPAAVLFHILRDPVAADGHDEGVAVLLNDMLDIASAQKELAEIEAETERIKELSLGGSTAAEDLRRVTIEEQAGASQAAQADIAKRVLDCVADYLAAKSRTYTNIAYNEIANLGRSLLQQDYDETTLLKHKAFDEIALRVINGLSQPGLLTVSQMDTVFPVMMEQLKALAGQTTRQ